MNKEDHLEYLEWMQARVNRYNLVFPKKEGAFTFESRMIFIDYVEAYKKECVARGWVDE